jgi:hypothetical protein
MQQREIGADYADTSITTKDPTMLHTRNYVSTTWSQAYPQGSAAILIVKMEAP